MEILSFKYSYYISASEFRNATCENNVEPDIQFPIGPQIVPTKSINSVTYAEPDPNVIVTPAGVVKQQSGVPTSALQSDPQAYAEPYQPRALPMIRNSADAYEDVDPIAVNQDKENTYEDHRSVDDTLVMKDSSKETDADNSLHTHSKPKKQVPSTDYATPQPVYTKVEKISNSKPKQPRLEEEMASDYSHLQATQTSNDESYQRLDRGIDVKMKDAR